MYELSINIQINFRCCCWSPKGKQIVVGFSNGKLVQYKPDLKPAKAIDCPPNIVAGAFDTISVQWLSTYQFAVVFLGQHENARPGKLQKYISTCQKLNKLIFL